jgi:CheY-like chemotaxis protein
MERQVRHLTRLVDDLLDVSRIQSGKIELRRERCRLEDIMAQAVEMSRPDLDRGKHHLALGLPKEPLFVNADVVRLTQVISNLLGNAARYTEPGGEVRLSAERIDSELRIQVADSGRGISPEHLPQIFEMFVRYSDHGGGLGIGLGLVRRLVELHGGRVTAESPGVGEGSVFTVYLPISDEKESVDRSAVTATREGASSPGEGRRIVVVDDSDDIRDGMFELLRSWGYLVDAAPDARRGIELILTTRPHAAFIDIGLPDLDGCEVARQVRRALSDATPRLLAMTGFGRAEDCARVKAAGFDAHLVKPASIDELRAALTPDGGARRSPPS